MKSNKLFIYTRVSVKLKIDKRGGQLRIERVDRTSPYTFLPFATASGNGLARAPATIQIPNPANVAVFRRSKFESWIASTDGKAMRSRHTTTT